MRLFASRDNKARRPADEAFQRLKTEYQKNGHIDFDGFGEPSDGFDGDFSEVSTGNILTVKLADVESRESTFVVFDSKDKPIAMLPNMSRNLGLSCGYGDFVSAVVRTLKNSEFKIIVTGVDGKKKSSDRTYFKCRTFEEIQGHHTN